MAKFQCLTQDYIKEHIQEFTGRKCVIITGAGISVSSGIPDFRSKNGIFKTIKEKLKIKGQDLFTYRYSRDKETRPTYYKFISNLKKITENAKPSKTHYFLQEYKKVQKKMRVYTQNIDLLEEQAGLKNCENGDLVYLHGNLKHLVCIYCGYKIEYTENENSIFEQGKDIECKKCIEENLKRKNSKIREVGIGYMHTNIIHYEQPHHDAYKIGKLFEKDMDVDLFIVIGTSLKVYGVKDLVKRGLRNCMINNGKSIFVNLEEPNKEYKSMFDYFWNGDCDMFCEAMKNEIEMMKIDDKLERLKLKKERSKTKIVEYTNFKEKCADIYESEIIECNYKASYANVDKQNGVDKKYTKELTKQKCTIEIGKQKYTKESTKSKSSEKITKIEKFEHFSQECSKDYTLENSKEKVQQNNSKIDKLQDLSTKNLDCIKENESIKKEIIQKYDKKLKDEICINNENTTNCKVSDNLIIEKESKTVLVPKKSQRKRRIRNKRLE